MTLREKYLKNGIRFYFDNGDVGVVVNNFRCVGRDGDAIKTNVVILLNRRGYYYTYSFNDDLCLLYGDLKVTKISRVSVARIFNLENPLDEKVLWEREA